MRLAIAKWVLNLQWWFIVVILLFSTVAFGGVHELSIYIIRLLVIFSLLLQVALFFSEDNYLGDFYPSIGLPTFFFAAFLCLARFQHLFGTRLLQNSIFGTVNAYATYNSFIQLVIYFLFFIACAKVASKQELVERLSSFIVALVFMITLLGLAQRLATSDRILWKSVSSSPTTFFGPFINENHFGGFLGLTFPLVLGLMSYRLDQIKRVSGQESQKKVFWMNWISLMDKGVVFLFFLAVVTLAACFFSLAMVSSFVLLFCCVVYFIAYARKRRGLHSYLILFIIFVSSFLLLQWLGYYLIASKFSSEHLRESLSIRFHVTKQSLALFFTYPFFGTGLSTYGFVSSHAVSYLVNEVWWNHVHNDYVELLIDTGIVGFFLFVGGILAILFLSRGQLKKNPSSWGKSMTYQAFLSIFCIGAMEYSDFHLKIPAIALFFTLQLAFLSQCSHNRRHQEASKSSAIRSSFGRVLMRWTLPPVGLCLSVFLFIFSTHHYRAYRLSQNEKDRLFNLKEAVQLQPVHAGLWYQLGKEYKKSADELQLKEKDLPAGEAGRNNTSILKRKAILALRKATALSPTYAPYWHSLGVLEYAMGYQEEGIASLEKSVYWAPAMLKYSIYLLAVYLRESEKRGKAEEKVEFLSKANSLYGRLQRLEVVPTSDHYRRWMGDYYYEKLQQLIPV